MGLIIHNAIIVTSSHDASIERAHAKASEIFPAVSPIIDSHVNHYRSFFIPPDGSKEGWDDSDEGDKNRTAFKEWIGEDFHCDWVEIRYGGDTEGPSRVVTDSEQWLDGEQEESEEEVRALLEGEINVGDELIWESEYPAARQEITVSKIDRAKGRVWTTDLRGNTVWNDESRIREACIRKP